MACTMTTGINLFSLHLELIEEGCLGTTFHAALYKYTTCFTLEIPFPPIPCIFSCGESPFYSFCRTLCVCCDDYNFTCHERVSCVCSSTIHIQQAVVTVHHHPQHTLGQPGQGSDVVRQSLDVIINQLEGGLCATLTVQCISDPRH